MAERVTSLFGGHQAQRRFLDEIESGSELNGDDIKFALLDAIFPVEQYSGTITTDLFAEDETPFFE
jgi:hypothetical protein